ncbi:uncharacterized protein LOC129807152 [Phlebotomus papatasi]|uniref:uncharacterized protein LOC129807152 n=1 Tax=Phlebotomus papatasi TaxID=29031 RepID=UPI0024833FCB|nr:uncharacterized protein LOC129807152 [Phlebotomus papatasi]
MSRQLNKRASFSQKEKLMDYIETHMDLMSKPKEPDLCFRIKEEWKKLGDILNSIRGSTKSASEWKQYLNDWKRRTSKKYQAVNASMQRSGNYDYNFLMNQFEEIDQRLIRIMTQEELEKVAGHPSESVTSGMSGAPLYIAGSTRSTSPENEIFVPIQPVSEVWIPKEEDITDEIEASQSSASSPVNVPKLPIPMPERKKPRKQDKIEKLDDKDENDSQMLQEMLAMKKEKLCHLKSMQKIAKKNFKLNLRKEEREDYIFEMLLKKDKREEEEHHIKMQILQAKLDVLKKELNK